MNPQKYNEHTALNHSILCRTPLSYDKPVKDTTPCHKQLNQLGTTGTSWRARNNMIHTNASFFLNKPPSTSIRKNNNPVNSLLTKDHKESSLTKSMVKTWRTDSQTMARSQALIQGMTQLKDMKLLAGKELQKVKFPGVIRNEHVHNDYHTRQTNPGYSRNYQGKVYTK